MYSNCNLYEDRSSNSLKYVILIIQNLTRNPKLIIFYIKNYQSFYRGGDKAKF